MGNYLLLNRIREELSTTEMLLRTIAIAAISGLNINPVKGYSNPAAIGINIVL